MASMFIVALMRPVLFSMIAAVVFGASAALWTALIWAPRHRRRQSDTARHLFGEQKSATWLAVDADDWSDDDRDTALRYYNTVGRQVRIGGIRVDLIPVEHRDKVLDLAATVTHTDERWVDLTWLGQKLRRRTSTAMVGDRNPSPPSAGNEKKLVKHRAEERASGGELADAMHIETLPRSGSEPSSPRSGGESEPDAADSGDKADCGDKAGDGLTTATIGSGDDKVDQQDPSGSELSEADQTDRRSGLGTVPAWILEAQQAASTAPDPDPELTTDAESHAPESMLAGSNFPWPDSESPSDVEVLQTMEFVPDVDLTGLTETESDVEDVKPQTESADDLVSAEALASSSAVAKRSSRYSPGSATSQTQHSTESAEENDSTDIDEATEALVDELERLRRKAKKARRRAKEARAVAAGQAKLGRKKKALAATELADRERSKAKQLKKRIKKLRGRLDA